MLTAVVWFFLAYMLLLLVIVLFFLPGVVLREHLRIRRMRRR